MTDENKILSMELKDGKLVISVDSNKDGEPVLSVSVDILEVPDELMKLLKKDKD